MPSHCQRAGNNVKLTPTKSQGARCAPIGENMPEGFLPAAMIVVAVLVYVLAKVVFYIRKSRRQWQEVDRSKLREWKDDEDS
jgi:hypothetical protein